MPVSATRCGQPCFIWLGVESLTVGVESCEEPLPMATRARGKFGRPSMVGAADTSTFLSLKAWKCTLKLYL